MAKAWIGLATHQWASWALNRRSFSLRGTMASLELELFMG
jgi:hypothetical protein